MSSVRAAVGVAALVTLAFSQAQAELHTLEVAGHGARPDSDRWQG